MGRNNIPRVPQKLFNDLCATVCFKKPSNVREFLTEELKRRDGHVASCGKLGFVSGSLCLRTLLVLRTDIFSFVRTADPSRWRIGIARDLKCGTRTTNRYFRERHERCWPSI